jgi:flavin reductase (DIM6/NTAB) family NADH-FMN oxidoreductase RutF
MTDSTPLDPRRFRDVMGRFATGVTVITAGEGEAQRGMTANSFTSVSLDPPLVLCCVATNAGMHPLFAAGERFAINMLAADQEAQSRHFAKSWAAAHPMGGFELKTGPHGATLLDGALAHVECTVHALFDGGDHTIVVGRVLSYDLHRSDAPPLLYFAGGYRALASTSNT